MTDSVYLQRPIRSMADIAAEFRARLATRRVGEHLSEERLRSLLAAAERELAIRREQQP